MTPGMKDAIKALIRRIMNGIGEQESGGIGSQSIVPAGRKL